MKTSTWIFACTLFLGACGDGTSGGDGGSATDTGSSDAGSSDAGGEADAGGETDASGETDAGGPGDDSGTGADAGPTNICTADMPCVGGLICAGSPSCDGAWSCIASGIPCTDDAVSYCGCDGVEFTDSSTCVTRPFRHRGACAGPTGLDCDASRVRCRLFPPMCPDGLVAEVEGTCWTTRCVPLIDCRCTDTAQCPEDTTCDTSAMRCQP